MCILVSECSQPLVCSGVDTRTGTTVSVQQPADFESAVTKLGLQYALGSLRLMRCPSVGHISFENVNTANLPAQSQDAQEATVQQGLPGGNKPEWVPLQLQLGLPLAPAELCDLVCR